MMCYVVFFVVFKQKTAYEVRISDWSSDVCSSDLMSPRNLLASTITDELKLATNFRSKVIGVAIKDRGSILPAGHAADAAYWFDGETGNFITSTYYMDKLPSWVDGFNKQKLVEKYLNQGWETLYPISSYIQSSADDNRYEGKLDRKRT